MKLVENGKCFRTSETDLGLLWLLRPSCPLEFYGLIMVYLLIIIFEFSDKFKFLFSYTKEKAEINLHIKL